MRYVLNTLAAAAPDWLAAQVPAEWFDRYARRLEDFRLPREKTARQALGAMIGADGFWLLTLRRRYAGAKMVTRRRLAS